MSRASSNKAKGRLGQQEVRDMLLKAFPELEEDDIRSTPMGADGEDLMMSPAARRFLPWMVEVKRKKAIAACRFMEQADTHKRNKSHEGCKPVAFFREDRGPWYAAVPAEYLIELIRRLNNA